MCCTRGHPNLSMVKKLGIEIANRKERVLSSYIPKTSNVFSYVHVICVCIKKFTLEKTY